MLVRLKDRPAPIQPESEALDVPFVIEKKEVQYDDAVDDYKAKGYVFAGICQSYNSFLQTNEVCPQVDLLLH